jgi:hypothetical protein
VALVAQPVREPADEEDADVVPLLIPMSLWSILRHLGQLEGCTPGEVLDRALCRYLDENGGKRAKAISDKMLKRQAIALDGVQK